MRKQSRFRNEGELKPLLKLSGDENGRIANALNVNIAARKQLDLFDSLTDEDRESLLIQDRERLIDRKGKPLSLSVEDIQLIKALSSYLPFHSPEIREYISGIDTMDAHGSIGAKQVKPIQIPISIPQLAKDIIGDTKEKSLRRIANGLKRLAEVRQAQTFYVKGKGGAEKYMVARPLIALLDEVYKYYSEIRSTKGRKKTGDKKEDKVLIGANVIYTSLFLYKATKEYCPLYKQRLFNVWKGNKTEMFAILLSDLESKWRQYYVASIKAETAAKEEYKQLKKENQNEYYSKVRTAKKAARIYAADTITIRNRLTTDYESTRQQRSRFIPDLQKAIASLVEYGIITEESHITRDKGKVLFFYNPDFLADELGRLLPKVEI